MSQALAVLTACYPVGRLPFGWLNQLRLISPAFQQKVDELCACMCVCVCVCVCACCLQACMCIKLYPYYVGKE